MTDGTSQGLFIVVAIVIFGIFVVLAYILFEDTLSPALANMFSTATEQATDRLVYKGDLLGAYTLNDSSFRNRLQIRGSTSYLQDNVNKYGNHDTMKLTFNGQGHKDSYIDDLVLYLDTTYNAGMDVGDKVKVSFYAKGESEVVLGTRLGNLWQLKIEGSSKDTTLTTEWKKYSMEYTIEKMNPLIPQPAIIFWTSEPASIWLHDIKVRVSP